jgi:hypothetical protein
MGFLISKYFLILFILIAVLSCNSNQIDKKISVEKTVSNFDDSLYILVEKDRSLNRFNESIGKLKNDSLKNMLISQRRKMYLDYNSFQELKINNEEVLKKNPCYSPLIVKMDRINNKSFTLKDLLNSTFDSNDYRANRFIVADFNTLDANGNCKGCNEEFPNIFNLTELKNLFNELFTSDIDPLEIDSIKLWIDKQVGNKKERLTKELKFWINLKDQIESYRTEPQKRNPIIKLGDVEYCIGQRLCLCELTGDTIVKVAQFITSSKNSIYFQGNQYDYDNQPRYYAPMNRLTSRFWDDNLKYTELDKFHDDEMGFASQYVILFNEKTPLPNFMHVTPDNAYPGAMGFVNGIHEFVEGGRAYMGAPKSLGCVRLFDYTSKFIRWWTPVNAKMFIHYEDKRYRQTPPPKS